MHRFIRKIQLDWRTVVAATLTVLAFPPYDLRFLIFVSLVPWFAALDRTRNWKQAAVQGLWFSILMSIGGFHWVAYVLKTFAVVPWPVAIVGLLLYSLIGQPQFTLFAPLQRRLLLRFSGSKTASPFLVLQLGFLGALAYCGLDWLLPKLFVDTLGHSLYSAPWLRQFADIGGAWSLTFAIYLLNETLWGFWKFYRTRDEPSAWPVVSRLKYQIGFVITLFVAITIYGVKRQGEILELMRTPERTVNFGVIQANIGDIDKIAAESGYRSAATKVLNTYYGLSEKALALTPRPDVIVWPETSYPSTFRSPSTAAELALDQELEAFVRRHATPLLFGGYDRSGGKDFNAFFFLRPSGDRGLSGKDDLEIYRKYILLPFGEFIPFAEHIQWVRETFPQVGYFGRGPGPSLHKVLDFNVSPVICYEALFSDFVSEAARKGSRLILNITNDSWFGRWGEPQLHLALSAFRSIESRLPQLRSTNTGISGLILPDGTITFPSALFEPQILNLAVPLIRPTPTVLTRYGDWFPKFALFIGWIGVFAVSCLNFRQSRSRSSP